MRASFVRIMFPAVLAVYTLLTVGVGVHVCKCCGTVDLTFSWKLALIWDSISGCATEEDEPCCDTQIYAIDETFCHRTDDSPGSAPELMDGPLLAYVPALEYGGSPCGGRFPYGSPVVRVAYPPGNILTDISQFRL